MKRAIIVTLLLLLSRPGGAETPYNVEGKVQADLEALLSRLISPEQFLVQVSADVVVHSERRLVEGELITTPPTEVPPPPTPAMPGFSPSFETKPAVRAAQQSRQVYRSVETPVLVAVRASVSFDRSLALETVNYAKHMVQNYLTENSPRSGRARFLSLPMLKPKKEIAPPPVVEK